jgi:hypothetical protein
MAIVDVTASYRTTISSGAVTTIAAGTASAGHIFAMRWVNANGIKMRLRALEVEFILTTAFTAAQEVGFDAFIARSYSAAATGATAITLGANDAKLRTADPSSLFIGAGDIRVANTGAMTAGTQTLDGQPIVKGSFWAGAIGAQGNVRRYDFSTLPYGGYLFATQEGFIVRNTILMGATGVGRWQFTPEWDECLVTG